MVETNIALPCLDDFKKISTGNITEFREQGHTLIENVLSADEMAAYRPAIVDAAERYNTEKRKLQDRDTYGKAFLQVMNLWENDEYARKFVFARRMAKIAADLMGVENVRLYHDQALFKEPGGGPTPWHQDQYYWPIDTNNTITMWMPLVDIDENMGMLTFASGSFKEEAVFNCEISDESETAFDNYVKEHQFPISRAKTMNAGDATWHRGFTIHHANGNNSSKMREVMTIIYIADGAKVTPHKNSWQKNDHHKWLLDSPIGELIDSVLNPKLL
ncbi:ectoine hydroxylase-related dioxygenase (phytanoyl-CoA dioxygenase family) [Mucilaginibacter frigoritolerans]|jgi:ectoine hydroxylase-related dioxygenase (phytanoyl-CoA dioxygenase family)|uniref:Ectoine hydroxylase-related dioxygenase (Phytanoyl-CoA dioxygenase family) n=1 Tax=Mucilaginibacter frigoritolerans TaxID=652788 RepID=A0A562TRQ1_9SPHI|nr:phytanoyl-CoA dioxygenase family protein [Mucilaginibacter frigoritolerans]TWI95884.1 ectoine hydroxylase-related dioxygenase (phytanoyl-CoA dioxygenase family) [Mucilaginibacter frigoritolerans]